MRNLTYFLNAKARLAFASLVVVATLSPVVTFGSSLAAQSPALDSPAAIAQDAANQVVALMARHAKTVDTRPIRVDEAASLRSLASLTEIVGSEVVRSSSSRIFPALQAEPSDSLLRCASPKTKQSWCTSLTSRQLLSLHGARQASPNVIVVRIKVLQWDQKSSQAPWMIAEVHYARGPKGIWVFEKIGNIFAS